MPPMLVVKRKMDIIKQLDKGDNVRQMPPSITQFFKNSSSNIIKMFLTSICIMAQSGFRSRKAQMPKRMASHPLKFETPN